MRRLAATVALSALVAIALPLPSASACSPARPVLELGSPTVPQGGRLRVSGDGVSGVPCVTPTAPVSPTPEPTSEPTETVSPSGEPSETATPTDSATPEPTATTTTPAPTVTTTTPAPAMVPVAHSKALTPPSLPVSVTITAWTPDWEPATAGPATTLGTADFTFEPIGDSGRHYHFSTTVKIPSDLTPGRYVVHGESPTDFDFGYAEVTVLAALPDTGTDVADATRLAVLLLLVGAGALALDRARSRVVAGPGRRTGD